MNTATKDLKPGITAWTLDAGVDLILRDKNLKEFRTRVDYESRSSMLGGKMVHVNMDEEGILELSLDDEFFELKLMPKGHYFSYLEPLPPKSDPISPKAALERFEKAKAKAKAKSRGK